MSEDIGSVAMSLIDLLIEEYGSDARITMAGIACEIAVGGDDSVIATQFTDGRLWVQKAFLSEVIEVLDLGPDDDDES